jgi:hypothetical protein
MALEEYGRILREGGCGVDGIQEMEVGGWAKVLL